MKEEYKPITEDQHLGYLVEECGEVLAAVGKAQRWGMSSINPEQETSNEPNYSWIMRELVDLKRAIKFLEKHIKEDY